jgi:hypothetical protein
MWSRFTAIWLIGWLLLTLGRGAWWPSIGLLLPVFGLIWVIAGTTMAVLALGSGIVQGLRNQLAFPVPLLAVAIGIAGAWLIGLVPSNSEWNFRLNRADYLGEIQRLFPDGKGSHEFTPAGFYLPLVYIGSDNPSDDDGACSFDGGVVKKLEPQWYVCQRDWN